ncbi:hypothetical protein [uncultured Gammaproteobacteria bacterium]|nr:hypothetical protein [uncultured Gammaproteobacteria bacterium]
MYASVSWNLHYPKTFDNFLKFLIFNRDNDIEQFKSKDFYEVHEVFNSIAAKRIINKETDTNFLDKENRIIDKDYSDNIVNQLVVKGNFIAPFF